MNPSHLGVERAQVPVFDVDLRALVRLVELTCRVPGAVIGTVPLILVASVHTAGTIIAFVSAMANSLVFDPISQQQSAIVAGFLSTVATLLIFVLEIHHLFIRAILDSYSLFEPGVPMDFGDTLHLLVRHVADSFKIGLQLATPFLVATVS